MFCWKEDFFCLIIDFSLKKNSIDRTDFGIVLGYVNIISYSLIVRLWLNNNDYYIEGKKKDGGVIVILCR